MILTDVRIDAVDVRWHHELHVKALVPVHIETSLVIVLILGHLVGLVAADAATVGRLVEWSERVGGGGCAQSCHSSLLVATKLISMVVELRVHVVEPLEACLVILKLLLTVLILMEVGVGLGVVRLVVLGVVREHRVALPGRRRRLLLVLHRVRQLACAFIVKVKVLALLVMALSLVIDRDLARRRS